MTEVEGYLEPNIATPRPPGISVQVLDSLDNGRRVGEWRSEDRRKEYLIGKGVPRSIGRAGARAAAQRLADELNARYG